MQTICTEMDASADILPLCKASNIPASSNAYQNTERIKRVTLGTWKIRFTNRASQDHQGLNMFTVL